MCLFLLIVSELIFVDTFYSEWLKCINKEKNEKILSFIGKLESRGLLMV